MVIRYIGVLLRATTHARRLRGAKCDAAYYRSELETTQIKLKQAEERVHAIEAERIEIWYPLPRGITNANR